MRGKRSKKRVIAKDRKYNDEIIGRLINKIMQGGKKTVAENIVYSALESGAKKSNIPVIEFLHTAIDNIRPALEIKSRRVGGANYQVPVPVNPRRQETLAVRWMVDLARSKGGKDISKLLEVEILNAFNGEGDALKKKGDIERMAEANKAFAHFRW
ncbi:MAG: 30S ribosomal protein S7, small subunit ribosomal protein S7 [candidate division WS6 bacterium GW2011_GWC1_33_20]|uniref:Small ribosomal subunit protein uS7 n=2 Tax=Candidatus Dojkabacteria TaxID=74243 RepID=A0A0G0CW62_9BACT|nr:MAG: 30S ribosomal protein S7, small subunit ribosomal protein S7 [candidate division WS6 bacterium GW2011_GWE2_33_157]KKP44029.1 MAG: 30S ribosomal protein S7, small subunit ribosomal protein S7 [candidate division WS6 bacterium GW2011_GWC1_33_20]KKP44253.1 MAG: 30S ribosomal protein S7, small subunit ribosomal protein S7 [candidate division WS6 bacterium GW2011_GWF1_33_233]KKP55300.1 MAG: 30S ribosomal protein S7 [candidate division WS6 bacterium GW2011_GWB1_33_6]KKP82669.1 MAG: 30S riboso